MNWPGQCSVIKTNIANQPPLKESSLAVNPDYTKVIILASTSHFATAHTPSTIEGQEQSHPGSKYS